AYRYSLSWPRVIPLGTGETNPLGLDFYDRLTDEILKAGIQPWVTLYHWDLPQALEDKGGWANPDIVGWFSEYAELVTKRLGDRVKHWITFNEPWCSASLGYLYGVHAPGLQDPQKAFAAAHHLLLSHGAGMQIIRRNVPDAQAGITLNLTPQIAATNHPDDIRIARRADGFSNRWYLDPVFKGQYPPDIVEEVMAMGGLVGVDLSEVKSAQQPMDFLGVNYYMRWVLAHVPGNPEGVQHAFPPESQFTDMEWEVNGAAMADLLVRVQQEYHPKALYVTENGAAYPEPETTTDAILEDPQRVAFLKEYFTSAQDAIRRGALLKGYFVWSFLDNFEWAYGYSKRFGIVHVDYKTQKRTPKRSALYLKDIIQTNMI
ncbi:MAG: family 1 glycosylhydrolase, partial [Anaerolineae bacterium]|nr:family 1 glycosylhydrolase [Anaerolineae bacterium]